MSRSPERGARLIAELVLLAVDAATWATRAIRRSCTRLIDAMRARG